MKIINTHIPATPEATHRHPRCIFVVMKPFTATWYNPILTDHGVRDIVTEESYPTGDIIHGESWRPEGVVMCRKWNAEGYTIDGPEMFLSWQDLANCNLATIN